MTTTDGTDHVSGSSTNAGNQQFRDAEERLWKSVGLEPREQMVRIEPTGVDVRIQEIGEGPPIIFVHGASNGGASWAHLLAGLHGFRCIAIDRPGCGLSEPLPYTLEELGDVESYADGLIPSLLDALDLKQADVVATSYGGYFALRAAAAHPTRIRRMVLFGWSIGAPMAKVPMMMRMGNFRPLGRIMTKMPVTKGAARMMLRQVGLDAAIASGRFTNEALDWFVALLRHTKTLRNELDTTPRIIFPFKGMNHDVLLAPDLLSKIEAPVYFLWGEDDPQGGAEVAVAFTAMIPDSELQMRSGVGHAPWIDEPEHSAAEVSSFLCE